MLDNNLVATRKSKLKLKSNKPAYIGIYISEVLTQEFHYDNIKNKYEC